MAKYDSLRKIKRNKELVDYALRNLDLSMKEIGKIYGISESRVSRILQKQKARQGS